MYRRYFNEYEKRAQQLSEPPKNESVTQKSAQSPPKNAQCPPNNPPRQPPVSLPPVHKPAQNEKAKILGKFRIDDILLLIVIFLLLKEDKKDMELILALGFIFLCDFNL